MLRILYLGRFGDPGFEGLVKITSSMKKHFRKRYDLAVQNLSRLKNVDVVHIHCAGFLEAIKYRNLRKVKVYSLHSNIICSPFKIMRDIYQFYSQFLEPGEKWSTQWKRANQFFWKTVSFMVPWFVKKYFLSKMDIVIVPSVWLQKKLRLKNSIVIRHGINVRHFKKVPSKHKLRVSYFGHIDPAKGFLEVIHTMKNLEYDVSIYPTRMNDKLRRYIRKCSPHIKVNGLVKDIRKAYNEADVVLLPYRHASGAIATPLVLLEAMACERAVITTDLPHIREICGNSVLYVKPNDVKGMERAVRRLAGDSKLRRELGKRARKRVVDNYDEKAMLKSYDKLYEALSHGISPKRILQTL